MNATHAYCDNCKRVRSVFFEELHPVETINMDGKWLAGDVVCKECAWIVTTLFRRAD